MTAAEHATAAGASVACCVPIRRSSFRALVEARVGDLLLGSVWLVVALALVVLGAATAHDGSRNG